jgi:hypothetical protein
MSGNLYPVADNLVNDACRLACTVVTIALTTIWILAVGVWKLGKCIHRTMKNKRDKRKAAAEELAKENAANAAGNGNVGGIHTPAGGDVPHNCTSQFDDDFKSVPAAPPVTPPNSGKKPFGSFFQKCKDKKADATDGPGATPKAQTAPRGKNVYADSDDDDDDIEKGKAAPDPAYETPEKAAPAPDPDHDTPDQAPPPSPSPPSPKSPPAPSSSKSPKDKVRSAMGKMKFMKKNKTPPPPPTPAAPFAPWWADGPAASKSHNVPMGGDEDATETTASTDPTEAPEDDATEHTTTTEEPPSEKKREKPTKEPTERSAEKPKKKKKQSKKKAMPEADDSVLDDTDAKDDGKLPSKPSKPKKAKVYYDADGNEMKDKPKKKKKKSKKTKKRTTGDDGIGVASTAFDESEAEFSEVTDTDMEDEEHGMPNRGPIPMPAM